MSSVGSRRGPWRLLAVLGVDGFPLALPAAHKALAAAALSDAAHLSRHTELEQ